jgi:hypothetical protein
MFLNLSYYPLSYMWMPSLCSPFSEYLQVLKADVRAQVGCAFRVQMFQCTEVLRTFNV